MAKRPSKKYSGVLIRPIEHRDWKCNGLMTGEFESSEVFTEQLRERWYALFDHYDIDRNDDMAGFDLALKLAYAHVPGFSIRARKTKPQVWNYAKLMKLRLAVNVIRSRHDGGGLRAKSLTASAACRILAKRTNFKEIRNLTAARLRRLYVEATERRKKYLCQLLSPWEVMSPMAGLPARRRAKLSHPYWEKRLRAGDPEALRHQELQKKALPKSAFGGLFALGSGWEDC